MAVNRTLAHLSDIRFADWQNANTLPGEAGVKRPAISGLAVTKVPHRCSAATYVFLCSGLSIQPLGPCFSNVQKISMNAA